MNRQDVLNFPVRRACGAPRHDYFFRSHQKTAESILEMAEYGREHGLTALLEREYPDTGAKNIIANVIDDQVFVADGNRHCAALLLIREELTFGDLERERPGLLRIWFAGVEEGRNTPETPYDVYIPADVDISRIPEAKLGTDWFKNPPAPTLIVPGSFRADSERLNEQDRGCPLGETALAVQRLYAFASGDDIPADSYARMPARLPFDTEGGRLYFDVQGDLMDSDPDFRGELRIPGEFRGQRVSRIRTDAFNRRAGLTAVVLPDTVRMIANAAFYATGLSRVKLPQRLEWVGPDAFGHCSSLEEVHFTGGCGLEIDGGAFAHCPKLRWVILPRNLERIGEGAFYGCDSLRDVWYEGPREQWEQISIGAGNDWLLRATLHTRD